MTRKRSFRKRGYFSNLTPTTESFNELTRTKLDAYVNYSRTFAEKHSLSAMAGYSYSRDKTNAFAASRREGGGSDLTPTLTAQPDRTSSTSSVSEIVMLSYFGRVKDYDYKKKYMLTATFRAERIVEVPQRQSVGLLPRHVRRTDLVRRTSWSLPAGWWTT